MSYSLSEMEDPDVSQLIYVHVFGYEKISLDHKIHVLITNDVRSSSGDKNGSISIYQLTEKVEIDVQAYFSLLLCN